MSGTAESRRDLISIALREGVKAYAVLDPTTDSYWILPSIDLSKIPAFRADQKHIIFVVDDSSSMVQDGRMRMAYQKALVQKLYDSLPEGTEVSLIAIRQTTVTLIDRKEKNAESARYFRSTITALQANSSTDLYGAFTQAKNAMEGSSIPSSATTVVLCSDGEDNVSIDKTETVDNRLKRLVDAFAEEHKHGIPAGIFVCFNSPCNTADENHLRILASLARRFKQPSLSIHDRPTLDHEIITAASATINQSFTNGFHAYMDALLKGIPNEVTRTLANGAIGKYLGTVNPGSSYSGLMCQVPRTDFEARAADQAIDFLFTRGDEAFPISTPVHVVTEGPQKDMLLLHLANQKLLEIQSKTAICLESTVNRIHEEITPITDSLPSSPELDDLLEKIAIYTRSPKSDVAREVKVAREIEPGHENEIHKVRFRYRNGRTDDVDAPAAETVKELRARLGAYQLMIETYELQDDETVGGAGLHTLSAVRVVMPANAEEEAAVKQTILEVNQEKASKTSAAAPAASAPPLEEAPAPSAPPLEVITLQIKLPGNEKFLMVTVPKAETTISDVLQEIARQKGIELSEVHVQLSTQDFRILKPNLPVETLSESDLEQFFYCDVEPKKFTVSTVSCYFDGRTSTVSLEDKPNPTVADLQTAIKAKIPALADPSTRFQISLSGQVLESPDVKLADIINFRSHSVFFISVMPSQGIATDNSGVMPRFNNPVFTSLALNNLLTITFASPDGIERTHSVNRTQTLREILYDLRILSHGDDETELLVQLSTADSNRRAALDLDRTLPEQRIGNDSVLVLRNRFGKAARTGLTSSVFETATLPFAASSPSMGINGGAGAEPSLPSAPSVITFGKIPTVAVMNDNDEACREAIQALIKSHTEPTNTTGFSSWFASLPNHVVSLMTILRKPKSEDIRQEAANILGKALTTPSEPKDCEKIRDLLDILSRQGFLYRPETEATLSS